METIYVLVHVVVMLGVGGSGGNVDKAYTEQSRPVQQFVTQSGCEKAQAALTSSPIDTTPRGMGDMFVCVPVGKR